MSRRGWWVALLLFGSGASALIYQTVWLRQFRLVFGATTSASAAVLAIFLGGLGAGGLYFGPKADGSGNPLALYARLEAGVALFASLTPLLLAVVRSVYLSIGGSFRLGMFGGTVVRLLMSTAVLGIPAFLMGGTLPAAARFVESTADRSRSALAAIYAANTLGAVTGTLLSTFVLLESLGNRLTLWTAALVNLVVAAAAFAISNSLRAPQGKSRVKRDEIAEGDSPTEEETGPVVDPRFVYAAACAAGFAFLLMELVWYRMLTPLLGGTTYSFGLILALALLGIGSGSFAYATFRRGQATVAAFALTCALEALSIAVPFALGDRIAVLALLLRPLGGMGFGGYVLGWTVVVALVVFAGAFAAGVQFPLLISLLGEGRSGIGRHVALTYAWNTLGAIAGSIAGGFGLLPLLTAPGAWRTAVVILALVAVAALLHGFAREHLFVRRASALLLTCATVAMLFATGPTAFWRHTPIGAGRADQGNTTPNRLRDLEAAGRRSIAWQADGVESSVAVSGDDGYAFIINGKGDGHARFDAGTQVMVGMLGGLLHPNPRRAMVIGLGTGTTAGWLAALPSIERVDVLEIEPATTHVADMCSSVSRDALHNPKTHIVIGDGREFLLARGGPYDIISSEPSNPYRAGVANLFTVEQYRAGLARLAPGGLFIQFLQAYEVDTATVESVLGSMTSVFGHVEAWQSQTGDLLLVGTREPIAYDWKSLQDKLKIEPVAEAVKHVWWATDPAAIVARYVAGDETARALGEGATRNTDDRTIIEYAFARTLGTADAFRVSQLRDFARRRDDDIPAFARSQRRLIERRRAEIGTPHDAIPDPPALPDNEIRMLNSVQTQYIRGDYADVWLLWQALQGNLQSPLETLTFAESLAERGDEAAMPFIDRLRTFAPIEAETLEARLRWKQEKLPEAAAAFRRAFIAYRSDPWPLPLVMRRALVSALDMADDARFPAIGPVLIEALRKPFAIHMYDEFRKSALLAVVQRTARGACTPLEVELLHEYEPNVPWQRPYLERRANCYGRFGDPMAQQAKRDLARFLRSEPKTLSAE